MPVHPRFGVNSTGYRVQSPNASNRAALVVALDPASAALGLRLAAEQWSAAVFTGFAAMGDGRPAHDTWEAAFASKAFDSIIMVGIHGQDLSLAGDIGQACVSRSIKVGAVLIVEDPEPNNVEGDLRRLRPWVHTLTVLHDATSLSGLLHALRA
jgi:hypothetical protein